MISRTERRFREGDKELIVMKLGTFIILLIFVSGPAHAQEKAAAPREQADRYQQIAYAAPADTSIVELYASLARKKFSSDPNLYSEIKRNDRSETKLIEEWRERVFKAVGTYSLPQQPDLLNDSRLQSNNEIEEQANANRMATRMVLKETLTFTQERLPEIDKLIRLLRFEVSTDSVSEKNVGTEIDENKNDEARTARNTPVKEGFLLKTGLRVPVESGKLGVTSETEARYGKMTSFFKVYLDGQYDNSLGLKYVLGKDIHLQVERQVAHTTDFVTSDTANEKSSLNLVQLVCKF
jgi:hypothetical protein